MPNYEVVEVYYKRWQIEAADDQEAYDLVMDGDESAILLSEDGHTESVTKIKENN